MRDVAKVLVAAAIGAAIGGAVVSWWSLPDLTPVTPPANTSRDAARSAAPAAVARTSPDEPRAAAPDVGEAASADPEREDGSLFTDPLRAFASSEIARGWRELRADDVPADVIERGLRDYELQLRTRAHWFGRNEAEQRHEADKKTTLLASDDVVAILAAITGDEPEAKDLVASDRFAQLFAHRGGGSGVDGPTLAGGAGVADGATVSFPAGVFTMPDLTPRAGAYPTDVTVRGAGMDATLLVWDTQRGGSPIQRFAVEDCTVFVDNALVTNHQAAVVVSFLRVRFVGFDGGHGGSYGLTFRSGAVHAVACRFEGGYGNAPSSYANVLNVGQAALARFQRCTFDRADIGDAGRNLFFVECAMTEMLAPQPHGPTFHNCRYTTIAEERKWDGDYRRRDLNALFPQWRERLQRR